MERLKQLMQIFRADANPLVSNPESRMTLCAD
jgi:hypothetical protein